MGDEAIAIVGIIFGNIVFGILVVAWWSMRKRRLELQAEVQTKLIERFGSSAELVEFLKSETGKSFVEGVQKGSIVITHERVLAGICSACWKEWEGMEVKVINEYRLNFMEPAHREMLKRACLDYLGLAVPE